MRYLAPIAMMLLSACSTLPPKHVAFPDARPPYEGVVETKGKFRDDLRQRDIPIHTYAPIGARPPFPIVIFSPDHGQDRESYQYLGRALARAGFYTVHLTHAALDTPENRALDVTFVLDRLAEDSLLDINRVALAGHGAGAATALAQRDKRVKAVVTMAGSTIGLIGPIGPVGQIGLTGVNASTFSATADPHHPAIAAIAAAFLRAWLFDDAPARAWFEDAGCGDVMGTRACVEHK